MKANTLYVITENHSKSKFADEFQPGDVIKFNGDKIAKNGRTLKQTFDGNNRRVFGNTIQLNEYSANDINLKVVTKAVAWGMKTFGQYAPTNGQDVINEMTASGLNAFKAVAKLAKLHQHISA